MNEDHDDDDGVTHIIVTTSNDLNLSRGIPDLRAMGSWSRFGNDDSNCLIMMMMMMISMTQTSDNGIGSENRSATEVEVVALSPQTHLKFI